MSLDNLKNTYTKEETDRLIALVRGKNIDDDLIDKLLESFPKRNKNGLKKKLARLQKEGKLDEAYANTVTVRGLKPEAKPMLLMISEDYETSEIAYALGVSVEEIDELFADEPTEEELEKKRLDKETQEKRQEVANQIKAGKITIEEAATKHNVTVEHVENVLTPYFKEEVNYVNKYIKQYNLEVEPALPNVTKVTTNILTAYKAIHDSSSGIDNIEDFIQLALSGKWPENG